MSKIISLYSYYAIKRALHYRLRLSKTVWHVCTPKSASSYLSRILENLLSPEFSTGDPIPFFGNRRHDPCVFSVNAQMGLKFKYYSGHLHALNTDFFEKKFMGKKTFVICQTRDLKDTLISILDHTKTYGSPPGPFFVGCPETWSSLDDEQKMAYLIANYVPFHLDFMHSWNRCKSRYDIEFEDITTSTQEVVQDLIRYAQIKRSSEEISAAISRVDKGDSSSYLLNKGISGRGEKISDANKKLIEIITSAIK